MKLSGTVFGTSPMPACRHASEAYDKLHIVDTEGIFWPFRIDFVWEGKAYNNGGM